MLGQGVPEWAWAGHYTHAPYRILSHSPLAHITSHHINATSCSVDKTHFYTLSAKGMTRFVRDVAGMYA